MINRFQSLLAHAKRNPQRSLLLLLVLAMSAFGGSRAFGQGYGTIVGTVTDASGAAVPSVPVVATATQTGAQTKVTTNAQGSFTFPTLLPTTYSITVTAPGFESYKQTGVALQANGSATLNIKLAVGATSETVQVTSEVPQVDTTSGTLAQVVDQERVVDLPLNGRNAASLLTLVAGVVSAPSNGLDQGTTKTFPVAVSVTANGSHSDQSNYLINGGNNVDEMTNVNAPFPFPDALQEFSVQTSNYSAEFGQSAGAVVNIVTKSGGRHFHGTLFEFLRNGFFDAKPYFGTAPDTLHRNQFGGTIGGPVILPKISKGESTQFFFGYQRTISHQLVQNSSAVVPTLAEEGLDPTLPGYKSYGDFSSFCTTGFSTAGICTTASQQIIDPLSNTPFLLNHIPVSRMDPAALGVEQHIPTPAQGTNTSGALVYFAKPTIQNYSEYFGRVDHAFSAHDHLFGHYYQNDFAQQGTFQPNNLLTYASFSNIRYQNALLSETHIFTNNLLNNLIVNYQREISLRGGPPGSTTVLNYGVTNIWQPPANVLNTISDSGYFSISASAFADFARNNYTFNDDLHWTRGNHNFTFGGHIELSKYDLNNVGTENGSFTFNSTNTNNALGSFQIGYLYGFAQGNAEFLANRNHFPGLYAEDSWKATRRLTLNYGLRWETFSPWTNKLNEQTLFNPAAYAANTSSKVVTTLPPGLLVAGDAGVPTQGVYSQYKQFMPRVGFALDIFGTGQTVLRGGGGIFYQDRLPGFFDQTQGSYTPYTIAVSLTNPVGPFSNPYCTGCATGSVHNPFPYTLPFPSNYVFPTPIQVAEYDPSGNFRVPVTYDYNLTVEQQIAPSVAMRLAYVGSLSRHEFVNLEVNPAVNNGTSLGTNLRRPYNTAPFVGPCTTTTGCAAAFAQITEASMSGAGSYNSLQATLEKKLRHGISILLNYTWSKALDDLPYTLNVSNTEDVNPGESYVYPLYPPGASSFNPRDIKALDRGPSDFDHPNTLTFSYVYDLPKMRTGFKAAREIVNGWRLTGVVQHHSGDALTLTAGKDISMTGLNQDRVQVAAGKGYYATQANKGTCVAGKSCINWLSASAFTLPTNTGPGTGFGSMQKGSIRGPAFTDWDAAVIRTFHVYRESSIEFRAEYFDLLNHTIPGDPATQLSSGSFGQITTENSSGPRIAQFSLKALF
jgi:hypothetical protein